MKRLIYLKKIIAHNLQIEKGRYIGVKTKDIICKLCNTRVENETHFLLQCPVLENKRTQIIDNIKNVNINFNNLPNKSKSYK
jgi:Zn finger protein HypA/HybF involved in hydrogenase expression